MSNSHLSYSSLGKFALALCLLSPISAQAQVAEVLITGSLISSVVEAPFITLPRRADNLISNVRVVCDTRDLSQREEELRQTLLTMIRAADQDPRIDLGLADDEIVVDFNEMMLDAVIQPDSRADTSYAILTIKTAITADDAFDAATGRITAFIEDANLVGRSEIMRLGDWNLTLVGPETSRDTLLGMISADSARTADMFGDNFDVEIDGLQLPVSWYRTGLLDLALFIPYEMRISSAP